MAIRARLRGWLALTAPAVVALYFASGPVASVARSQLGLSPLWGVLVSARLVALSHSTEPLLPPRTIDPWRWIPLRTFLLGPDLSVGDRVRRILHLAGILIMGTIAETWASMRLMPYNWLMLMMRFGYGKERSTELKPWAERAWASGNPALDFIGIGGGTFLVPPPSHTASTTPQE